jgi:hypothetical protein
MSAMQQAGWLLATGINAIIVAALFLIAIDILAFYLLAV